jgi:peroxiredoxin Q/BCP
MSLQKGDPAPDFSLPASGGRTAALASLQGKPLVLYFYPRADTPGCTREACAFQDALAQLGSIGLTVIGVSRDKLPQVEQFAQKYGLQFPLASDEDGAVSQAYGTWIEKTNYGRKYMGMDRATFLIDASGRIARIWRKVKVNGHVQQVVEAAKTLA